VVVLPFLRRPPGLIGAAAVVVAVLIALFALLLASGAFAPVLDPRPTPGGDAGAVDRGTRSPGASTPEPAVPGDGVAVLAGAGDIGRCGAAAAEATAALLDEIEGIVFTTGDNAYPSGRERDFRDCYDPTWGRHLHRTRPAPGNHDYRTAGAAGYRDYFGDAASGPDGSTWYAYRAADWQVIVLDSNCSEAGGCGPDSAQGRWLRSTLADDPATCTLAIWHHPRFSSGWHGGTGSVATFWEALHEAGAELVVNGHEHSYERFAPQDPDGRPDPERGIRQLVVGTGGTSLRGFGRPRPNSEVRHAGGHGVLRLTLREGGYDWAFVAVPGSDFRDEGSGTCR
jgi:acid phosphatase type 7